VPDEPGVEALGLFGKPLVVTPTTKQHYRADGSLSRSSTQKTESPTG